MSQIHLLPFFLRVPSWTGKGFLTLEPMGSQAPLKIEWQITADTKETINCIQMVYLAQEKEPMKNYLRFSHFDGSHFSVHLESEAIGSVIGKGTYDENVMAWELRSHNQFDGFESYRTTENGCEMHAEYISNDFVRTVIEGKLVTSGA